MNTDSAHNPGFTPGILPTAAGVAAILVWSTMIAASRDLAEHVGTFRAAAGAYLISGIIGALVLAIRPGALRGTIRLPRSYVLVCGLLFLANMVGIPLAVGLAETRPQVLGVGLTNYLWPSLTVLFAAPIQRAKVRWAVLLPGLLTALSGVALAIGWTGGVSMRGILAEVGRTPGPFLLALMAAVSWALYSNLSRRWAQAAETSGVPLFLIATAATLLIIQRLMPPEPAPVWSFGVVSRLLYVGVFPNCLAYILWDAAMRRGRMLFVAVLSYLIPLLSTLISCAVLDMRMG